jgi:hypothetical protein
MTYNEQIGRLHGLIRILENKIKEMSKYKGVGNEISFLNRELKKAEIELDVLKHYN